MADGPLVTKFHQMTKEERDLKEAIYALNRLTDSYDDGAPIKEQITKSRDMLWSEGVTRFDWSEGVTRFDWSEF